MSRNYTIRVQTGQIVTMPDPLPGIPIFDYPSTWFAEHPGEKPHLNITLLTKDLDSIRGVIKKSITDNAVTKEAANTFIFHFAKTVKAKLDAKWESYGVLIGENDDLLTPLDLLSVKVTYEEKSEAEASVSASKEDDLWMMVYLLGTYRLVKVKGGFRDVLKAKLTAQMKALNHTASNMKDVLVPGDWEHNREFNVLVAAFDMFFNKFPAHEYAKIRIDTTTGSRFRSCTALKSYLDPKEAGLPSDTNIKGWIWNKDVGNDLKRMLKEGEELEDPISYFPYQVDMHLVSRSAYAAVANPNFYNWIHLVGCLLQSQRSINAFYVKMDNLITEQKILTKASCMAYAFAHTTTEENGNLDYKDKDFIQKALKSRGSDNWLILLRKTNEKLPFEVKKWVEDVVKKIHAKNGTVGAHLKTKIDRLESYP